MQLESLPNELLLNLFEFFNTVQLLRSFFGLNIRFNQLVYNHFRNSQFNLQSISKNDFDIICQQHLPIILNRIISFRLSNEETPDLTELFLSRSFRLDRFICLQSLSLHYISSLNTLIKITYQCRHLPHLIYLNIIKCDVKETQNNITDLFKNIWNISKLIHCKLNAIKLIRTSFFPIVATSSSIEHLFIENISCNLNNLFHLFKYTPCLQTVSVRLDPFQYKSPTFIIPSITTLKIFCDGSIDLMKSIFSNMPNLHQLTIETFLEYLDGHKWKQIIIDYLSKIKIFQLKMKFDFEQRHDDVNDIIDELLDSFRSSFWIEEHQWYVRCHWDPSDPYTRMTLYTLPYAFNSFDAFDCSNKCCTKSTCLDERQYQSYDRVQMFYYDSVKHTALSNFSRVSDQFPNLRCLNIMLSYFNDFYLKNGMFNQLTSLRVTISYGLNCHHLQTLFDRAPHLYSVEIIFNSRFSAELFQLRSNSIRRLSIWKQGDSRYQFPKEEYIAFFASELGRQCEVLSIEIEDRFSIVNLIQSMANLRLLNVRCKDDIRNDSRNSFTNYDLVHWMQNHFSSTYTIIRNPEHSSFIQVWINQNEKLSKDGHKVSQLLTSIQRFFLRK